jgi:hypothetical protein
MTISTIQAQYEDLSLTVELDYEADDSANVSCVFKDDCIDIIVGKDDVPLSDVVYEKCEINGAPIFLTHEEAWEYLQNLDDSLDEYDFEIIGFGED